MFCAFWHVSCFPPSLPHQQVISAEQMHKGFARLVDALEDTLLDVPDATELLSLFIARAVVDDILPPAAVTKWCPAPEVSVWGRQGCVVGVWKVCGCVVDDILPRTQGECVGDCRGV